MPAPEVPRGGLAGIVLQPGDQLLQVVSAFERLAADDELRSHRDGRDRLEIGDHVIGQLEDRAVEHMRAPMADRDRGSVRGRTRDACACDAAEAPATFSTTTVVRSSAAIRSDRIRASVSVGPPAANGTMRVMGRRGSDWALGPGRCDVRHPSNARSKTITWPRNAPHSPRILPPALVRARMLSAGWRPSERYRAARGKQEF